MASFRGSLTPHLLQCSMFVCRLSKRGSYNHRSSSNTSLKDVGKLPASDRIAHGLDLRHRGRTRLPVSATLIIPKLTRYSAAGSPNTLGGSWCSVFPRITHTAPVTVQHLCLPAQQAGVLTPSQQLKYFTQRCRKTAGIRSHCTRFGS